MARDVTVPGHAGGPPALEAHVVTSHPGPLSDERALEAWTYIDLSYASGWERLFVAPARDGLWRLCNLPYQVYGLKVGSVVSVDRTGRISGCEGSPLEPAYRLRMREASVRDACLDALGDCWVEPMYTVFVGVQPMPGRPVEVFLAALDGLIAAGLVTDVEDVCGQPFDPGPATTAHAAPGLRPGVHQPSGEGGRR